MASFFNNMAIISSYNNNRFGQNSRATRRNRNKPNSSRRQHPRGRPLRPPQSPRSQNNLSFHRRSYINQPTRCSAARGNRPESPPPDHGLLRPPQPLRPQRRAVVRVPGASRSNINTARDIPRYQSLARPQSPDDYTLSSAPFENIASVSLSYEHNYDGDSSTSTIRYHDLHPRFVENASCDESQCTSIQSSCNQPHPHGICESDPKESESWTRVIDDCPLCLEKLLNEDIGVTVPCGHCFHWKCFQECRKSWRANKCPTCRKPISNFVQIYITTTKFHGDSSSDNFEENAVQSLRIQNVALRKDKAMLEEELEKIKKATRAEERLLERSLLIKTIPQFTKGISGNIQRIGNGLHYVYCCIKQGCIGAQSEDQVSSSGNIIVTMNG